MRKHEAKSIPASFCVAEAHTQSIRSLPLRRLPFSFALPFTLPLSLSLPFTFTFTFSFSFPLAFSLALGLTLGLSCHHNKAILFLFLFSPLNHGIVSINVDIDILWGRSTKGLPRDDRYGDTAVKIGVGVGGSSVLWSRGSSSGGVEGF